MVGYFVKDNKLSVWYTAVCIVFVSEVDMVVSFRECPWSRRIHHSLNVERTILIRSFVDLESDPPVPRSGQLQYSRSHFQFVVHRCLRAESHRGTSFPRSNALRILHASRYIVVPRTGCLVVAMSRCCDVRSAIHKLVPIIFDHRHAWMWHLCLWLILCINS